MSKGYEVTLKEVPDQRVATIRETITSYGRVGTLFAALHAALAAAKLMPDGPQLAIYFDEDYQPQNVDVAVAVPLATGDLPPDSRAQIDTLPGGLMVSLLREGRFNSDFRPAYRAMMTWVQESGYRIAGPNREIWIRGPGSGSPPETFLMEIQFPVQKA